MKTIASAAIVRTIKRHQAYKYNVYREAEANVTLIANADGTFTIDDWGCESEGYGRCFDNVQLDNISLDRALNILLKVNQINARHDRYSVAWNMSGLP